MKKKKRAIGVWGTRVQGRWNERPETDVFILEDYQASGETIAHL